MARLRLTVTRQGSGPARALGDKVLCTVVPAEQSGVPFFLGRFRRRYALLVGLALSLTAVCVLSQFVLTIEVEGNEAVSTAEILTELRRQGLRPGVYGPGLDEGTISSAALLGLPELAWMSVNLHGTRAEVIVREGDPAPEIRAETVPTDVVSSATGVITHIEPWVGDAQFQEGEAVCEGDVLISGRMEMDTVTPTEHDLGTMLVHAEGKVLAQTWHTLTAQISLKAQVKTYTGEEIRHYSLSLMGKRVKFYQNSGIPYENYDTISEQRAWTPIQGKQLPVVWEKETHRAYETREITLDPAQAEEMLRQALMEALEEQMEEGKVLQADYEVTRQGDLLQVKLVAQCTEQIGRMVEMDTQEKAVGPRHPEKGTTGADEKTKEAERAEE